MQSWFALTQMKVDCVIVLFTLLNLKHVSSNLHYYNSIENRNKEQVHITKTSQVSVIENTTKSPSFLPFCFFFFYIF